MVSTPPEHISVIGLEIVNALVRLDMYEQTSRTCSLESLLVCSNIERLCNPLRLVSNPASRGM